MYFFNLFTRLLLLFCFALLFASCSAPDPFHTLTGSWHLIAFQDLEMGEATLEPDHIARPIVIDFTDKGKRGDYFGETVTNEIWGQYRLGETSSLEFLDLDGTWKGEPIWGDNFREALTTVASYQVESELMYLSFDQGRKRLVFERNN